MERREYQIQQGDVILERIEEIPKKAKKVNHRMLAKGEATGHHHSLTNLGLALLLQDGENKYLKVKQETEIEHQEHKKVRVPAGNWKVKQVFEYDPFEEEARRVID